MAEDRSDSDQKIDDADVSAARDLVDGLPKVMLPEELRRLSPEEREQLIKSLKKKIDTRLLPMVILMYIMNYLDRNNIASARLTGKTGLETELGLHGDQYQLCISILFVGYILMQVPSNLFLNKFGKPALYLPTAMVIWGTISAATGAVQSFGGLLANRFFLGFVEAAYFVSLVPGGFGRASGIELLVSTWYTRKELALRTALLYSGSLLSGAFSGLIAAGISNGMDGSLGLSAWRWLFIIEGSITVAFAFAAYFILPNFPRTTGWLTETEKALAIWRLEQDIGLDDWVSSKDQTFFDGFRMAFTDIKTYFLMVITFGCVSSASVTNFFPTVVGTLGYDEIPTLLITAPPFILAVITSATNAWHADRTGERYFHITLPLWVAVAVFILAAATTNTAARFVAMMLMPASFYSGYVVALAWICNTIPRPPAKRAAAVAAINAGSNVAQIYTSFMYEDDLEPRFIAAFSVNTGTALMAIIGATILRLILVRLNKKLDRGEYVEGAVMAQPTVETRDAADKGFRFLV